MNAVVKPKRTWKVTKAGYLATIAQLRERLEAIEGERDEVIGEGFDLRVEATALQERIGELEHDRRVLAVSAIAGLVGMVLGVWL